MGHGNFECTNDVAEFPGNISDIADVRTHYFLMTIIFFWESGR
jgi:hypothetical protein